MTAKYPYLKLSLRYVHGTKSTTVFSYPASERMPRAPFDASDIISRFVNLSEFYVMGCHDRCRFYSFVSADDADHTGARLELTLTTDSNVLLVGRTILNLFNCIKDMLESDEAFTDDSLAAAMNASGFSDEPLLSPSDYAGNDLSGRPCYRTYVSPNELGTIMSFPRQNAYADYSEVVLVNVTSVASVENPIPQISGPVAQAFTVICPEGVTSSAETVEITDRLSLTYARAGFDPTTETFEVGTTNRYVKIAGPALIVADADKAGVVFLQHVAYRINSSKGGEVKTYTILINGRTATRTDGVFEITSNDFDKSGNVDIQVASTNFFTTSLRMTSAELAAAQPLEIVLVPEELPVVLRMDFGDGRMMQQEIMLEKNSGEYRQLRAGRFHGFRAHRMMSHDPETYNIDMAVTVAPAQAAAKSETVNSAAPAVRTVADTYSSAASQPSADKKEEKIKKEAEDPSLLSVSVEIDRPKSPAEIRAERLRRDIPTKEESASESADEKKSKKQEVKEKKEKIKDQPRRKAYADDIPRKIDILEDDPDDDDEHSGRRSLVSPVILAAIVVVLIIAGIVWYLFTLLPTGDASETEAVDVTTEQVEDINKADRIAVIDDVTADQAANADTDKPADTAASPSADEKADIEYLNANLTWRLADLKSQKYRDFFSSLGDGDIDAIANSDYFAVKDQATNDKALKVIGYLWEAKGTFAEKRNVNAMKELKGKESIDLHQLYENLARMRDAKPNKSERPQR